MSSGKYSPSDSVQSAEALYAKATAAEHARDFDTAFQSYISAAQAFLQRARSVSGNAQESARAKSMLQTCLDRAEHIKAARKDALKPLSTNPLAPSECVFCSFISMRIEAIQTSSNTYSIDLHQSTVFACLYAPTSVSVPRQYPIQSELYLSNERGQVIRLTAA